MGWFYRLGDWWLNLAGKDRATIILEILGIVVVGVYTTVAAMQWSQMKTANDNAIRAMETAERPWVGIEGPLNVVGSIHENAAKVNFSFLLKNGGRSVALGVDIFLWIDGGIAGFKLMESDHCEDMVKNERQAIKLMREYEKHGGSKAPGLTAGTMLPNDTEQYQIAPQIGAPNRPTENVYALLCIVYFDEFDVAHLTQATYCFTNRFPKLQDVPLICGKGNYAY